MRNLINSPVCREVRSEKAQVGLEGTNKRCSLLFHLESLLRSSLHIHEMWVSEKADVYSVEILYVTQASYQHCDFLSTLGHNFLNLLSEIMLHVMTASTPNIACKWVRSDICIINLLSYICGRHKWCQRYVTHNIL